MNIIISIDEASTEPLQPPNINVNFPLKRKVTIDIENY